MAKEKKNNMSSLSLNELREKMKEANVELFKLRIQHATGQLSNTSLLSATRKQIARLKTFETMKSSQK